MAYVVSAVACQLRPTTETSDPCWGLVVLSWAAWATTGASAATTAVGVAAAELDPDPLVAVTRTVTVEPSSASASV